MFEADFDYCMIEIPVLRSAWLEVVVSSEVTLWSDSIVGMDMTFTDETAIEKMGRNEVPNAIAADLAMWGEREVGGVVGVACSIHPST